MPLEHLWAYSPCRRPVSIRPLPRWDAPEVPVVKVALPKTGQKPLRHARMPLKHLWARSPCQRPVSIRPLPRWDATEVPVGRVVVPKTVQKPPSPRRDASGAPVGKVSVPKAGQYSSFAKPGCLWSTCGQGLRAEDQSEVSLRHARMPLDHLWAYSPCRWVCRAPNPDLNVHKTA